MGWGWRGRGRISRQSQGRCPPVPGDNRLSSVVDVLNSRCAREGERGCDASSSSGLGGVDLLERGRGEDRRRRCAVEVRVDRLWSAERNGFVRG